MRLPPQVASRIAVDERIGTLSLGNNAPLAKPTPLVGPDQHDQWRTPQARCACEDGSRAHEQGGGENEGGRGENWALEPECVQWWHIGSPDGPAPR